MAAVANAAKATKAANNAHTAEISAMVRSPADPEIPLNQLRVGNRYRIQHRGYPGVTRYRQPDRIGRVVRFFTAESILGQGSPGAEFEELTRGPPRGTFRIEDWGFHEPPEAANTAKRALRLVGNRSMVNTRPSASGEPPVLPFNALAEIGGYLGLERPRPTPPATTPPAAAAAAPERKNRRSRKNNKSRRRNRR